jgi:hypothetical protein
MAKHVKSKKDRELVKRSSDGLRDALFDEIDGLRNGTTTATNANAVARLADQINNTVHLELLVHKQLSGGKRMSKLPPVLAFGG